MKFDVVLAGVGGQGVLSVAAIIAAAAREEGLAVTQSETHGMAQRGGAVTAELRLADAPIASGLIPRGRAAMVLAMEPLEGLRHLQALAPDGILVASSTPLVNIPDYPPLEEVLARIEALPRAVLVDAEGIARGAGSARAANVAMVGAASPFLPVRAETLEGCIDRRFRRKGEAVLTANLKAFRRARRNGG